MTELRSLLTIRKDWTVENGSEAALANAVRSGADIAIRLATAAYNEVMPFPGLSITKGRVGGLQLYHVSPRTRIDFGGDRYDASFSYFSDGTCFQLRRPHRHASVRNQIHVLNDVRMGTYHRLEWVAGAPWVDISDLDTTLLVKRVLSGGRVKVSVQLNDDEFVSPIYIATSDNNGDAILTARSMPCAVNRAPVLEIVDLLLSLPDRASIKIERWREAQPNRLSLKFLLSVITKSWAFSDVAYASTRARIRFLAEHE